MMITPNLNDGESYVEGRSEETARVLYEAAKEAGIDIALISTASHGYVVPRELADKLDGAEIKQAEDQPAVPTEPGTTTDPKEAWNAEAWKAEQEELGTKNVEDGAKAIIKPVEDNQAEADGRQAAKVSEAEGPLTGEAKPAGDFDPAEHTVEEVKEYLDSADDKERDRVIAAEEASEKPRRGILKLADEEEGDK